MAKFLKIKLVGGSSYIQPISELATAFDGELDGAEVGQKWEIELIEMKQEEYESLSEFNGH